MGQALGGLLLSPLYRWTDEWQEQVRSSTGTSGRFLKENYRPVRREGFTDGLAVRGVIPEDLVGEFVRNGPNPKYSPKGRRTPRRWKGGD